MHFLQYTMVWHTRTLTVMHCMNIMVSEILGEKQILFVCISSELLQYETVSEMCVCVCVYIYIYIFNFLVLKGIFNFTCCKGVNIDTF